MHTMYKIYLTARSLNEATSYYIGLIEQAVQGTGASSARVYAVKDIHPGDSIITVEAKDFFYLSLRRPKNPKINWYQGITPEEAMMVYGNPLRKLLWEVFERHSLKKAALNIFVSRAMWQHYREKYNYRGENHVEIPCYNQQLDEASFHLEGKYSRPTFAYTGSLSKWQCVAQVLQVHQLLEQRLPGAHLSLFTREVEEARLLVARYGLQNVRIAHVPLAQLNEALQSIKYGWLLREDVAVNQVATPTKMNSYMANGMIPVYSDVVTAFREQLPLGPYAVRIRAGATVEAIAAQVISYEREQAISPDGLYAHYLKIFSRFYNDDYYIELLRSALSQLRNI